ncbi:hypothetical protein NX059_011784 [Plenodomus lindquistii]|nr:hypothetical protein NX059_011784 [Plenodomus lindquistii]
MSLCVLCNRTFGDEIALRSHEKNSPKHVPFGCKACNRSFGSQAALNQHQNDSPAHQRPRADSVTTSSTPGPLVNRPTSPSSTTARVRHPVSNSERNRHATTKNTSQADSTFDRPFEVLENQLRALAISDVDTTVPSPESNRAQISTRTMETRSFFTYPELHQRIAEAVLPEITSTWFNPDMEAHFDTDHETNIMGNFTCENKRCRKRQWSSLVVAVWIKGYYRNGYNAIVYNQRCKLCDWLGRFKLDEASYVERITYRLKRWAGVRVEQLPFGGPSKGPHESGHCEGCKAGHCSQADRF